ncbi:MAG TPA: hypothetical protein VFR05_11700 [Terriglobia bacterium]|nr:hypothetical protein [Terriglobia bacterium]
MKFASRRAVQGLLILAPPSSVFDASLGYCQTDEFQYNALLSEAQRLRGRIYFEDGAVDARRILEDGRLVHPDDERSWQLLVMNDGAVAGCARYVPYDATVAFTKLGVARSALAGSRPWGASLRRAVEAERAAARRRGIGFAEVGGWALAEELRYSGAALEIFTNVCALAKLFGGAVAITTATFRHNSSSILRKLGGRALVGDNGIELPSYYDPQYDCEMEILRFDTDCPNPRYGRRIDECLQSLATVLGIYTPSISAAYAMSV